MRDEVELDNLLDNEAQKPSGPRSEIVNTPEVHATHTPGPWRVSAECNMRYVRSSDSRIVSTAYSLCNGIDNAAKEKEADANARLVAAAPALYEALKVMLYIFDRELPDTSIGRKTCDEALAALALVDSVSIKEQR